MSKLAAWLVKPDAEPESIELTLGDRVLGEVSRRFFDNATLDLTKVRFKGRLCHMAVDDEGLCKGLPYNRVATEAYLANCRPGTVYHIAGTAVIFGGMLP